MSEDSYSRFARPTEFDVPATMQAVVACGRGFQNLEIREVPVPEPGPDQLLARVDAAGVCTSNLKIVAQGEDHSHIGGWDLRKWPIILGDEGAVTLVRVGGNLQDLYSVGQRVAIQPAVGVPPILHRERYRNNAQGLHRCAVGYTLPGHLAQYILIQEEVLAGRCLLPLPDADLPYFAVSMGEPIGCIYSAQERNYHILKDGPLAERRPAMGLLAGGVAVVVGAGAMGRMHAELALRFGPTALIVCDLDEKRLGMVTRTIGAKAGQKGIELRCVTPDKLQAAVNRVSGGRGADDIMLAVGVREVQQDALRLLAPAGVANLFGGLSKGEHVIDVDALAIHYREIKLVGSSGGDPSDMSAALAAIATGDIDPGNYVAAVGSLDNAIDVLNMIRETKIEGKAILYPHVRSTPLEMVDRWDKAKEIEFLNRALA